MRLVDDSEIRVTVEDPHGAAAIRLIKNLSSELGERYGDDGSGAFSPDDVLVSGGAFVIAWIDSRAVGCGALRPLGPGIGELKRMFVEQDVRRQGVASRILGALEAIACEFGYHTLRLETGLRQPEAIHLYESTGFARIPCYGQYVDNPLSICFEKRLGWCPL